MGKFVKDNKPVFLKCDRCGSLYQRPDGWEKSKNNSDFIYENTMFARKHSVKAISNGVLKATYDDADTWNLCPDCAKQLDSWLENFVELRQN